MTPTDSNILVAPSLLACDFTDVKREVARCLEAGADMLHLDFMDGHFVPNLSFGFPIVEALVNTFDDLPPLDVHLMVSNPESYLERLAGMGVWQISIHWEASLHVHRALQQIKDLGVKAGVAFNPHTPLGGLEHVLDLVDNVLIMTVNPGFGGQAFLSSMLAKVSQARGMAALSQRRITVCVDGGVNAGTGPDCVRAGADLLVAGSYLFKSEDMTAAVEGLRT